MGRGLAGAFALCCVTAACVGPNPRWDGPADDGADDDDDDGAAGSSGASVDGSGDDEVASEGSGGGEESSGGGEESSGGVANTDGGMPMPMCPPDQTVCDGMCKNPDVDKHFCGAECIDCVAMLGMAAECDRGECREDNSGPGGDDD